MSSTPLCLVTLGPAYSPIDEVRRITNVSTGELGSLLCDALHDHGFRVYCLAGEMSIHRPSKVEVNSFFSTNDSLFDDLVFLSQDLDFVFHTAALCDFEASSPTGSHRKIPSDSDFLEITLRRAAKILPELPRLAPKAKIVGWKYELDGSQADAIARGRKQIREAGTTACVVNGAAYGPGFGFLDGAEAKPLHYPDKTALCAGLAQWAANR